MIENWEKSFALMIKHEGGYVWDKDDAGGETNLGVTKAAWSQYLGRAIEDGEMKALTVEVVKPFYKKCYWDKVQGDKLPTGIDYLAFDFAVNAGVGQSAKFLQRCVGATEDGAIGPITLAKIAEADADDLVEKFTKVKTDFYNDIVARKPSQAKFLKGWLNRVASTHSTATTMIA